MSAETHIYLVRHGQTDWNVARKVMGKLAIPLNETGQAQAEAAKVFLAGVPVDHIFHSPHLRTRQTAQIIAQAHPHVLPEAHHPLCEVDYGLWEGKSFAELSEEAAFKAYFDDPDRCEIPGGDCMADVKTRMAAFIEGLRASHGGKRLVLVSHSDTIKAALIHYLALPLSAIHRLAIDNGSVSMLLFTQTAVRVVAVNRTPGMPALFARSL